jgi:hypothetical protein
MDLTCGVRRIALRRKSVWYLRPDLSLQVDEDFARHAVDTFTEAAGWTAKALEKQQPALSEDAMVQVVRATDTSAISRLLDMLRRID